MSDPTPEPMHPVDPDHGGDREAGVDDTETDDVGTDIDPVDPLKRADDADMPGLDPVVPIIPSD